MTLIAKTKFHFISICLCLAANGVSASDEPGLGTFNVDVVQLISHQKELPGSAELSADRCGYRYLFSSTANRETFLQAPEKYEVQLGGACGKMGELSGRGSPERYWVYRDRLYVFASDGCQTSFKTNPEGHLDRDDPPPAGSSEASEKGRTILKRAVKWSGLDSLAPAGGISTTYESSYQQSGTNFPMSLVAIVRRNGDYLDRSRYNGSGYTQELRDGTGLETNPEGKVETLVLSWKRALERQRNRTLAHVLLSCDSPNSTALLQAVQNGVAEVKTYTDGISSTLFVEEKSGKVLTYETNGRGRSGVFGRVKHIYTAYDTVDGITFPVAWSATFDDEPSKAHSRDRLQLKVLSK